MAAIADVRETRVNATRSVEVRSSVSDERAGVVGVVYTATLAPWFCGPTSFLHLGHRNSLMNGIRSVASPMAVAEPSGSLQAGVAYTPAAVAICRGARKSTSKPALRSPRGTRRQQR